MPGSLYVDAGQDLGAISPLVYGSNFGPRFGVIPLSVKPQAITAKLTYLRYPDGNWGDQNDLDEYQIDQFIKMCREMSIQPAISVRLRGGTVQSAAALVRYANVSKGYQVQWWSIGNEPSLYSDFDTVRYNQEWRQYAGAMRAIDPTIKLIGPDIHQFTANASANPKDKAGRDWMEEFLKANGDLVDVVSIHRYAFPRSQTSGPPTIEDLRANSQEWDAIIPTLRAVVRQYAGRDLPVAVTEVNSSWAANTGGDATLDSFYNAIWWGDSLGRMIRQGVSIVAQFELISEWGLMNTFEVRPIYYVYRMYQNFGSQLVYASSDEPDVTVFAAKRPDGTLTVMLVNLGPDSLVKSLKLAGHNPSGPAQVWRLDATHNAEQLADETLGEKIALPGQSMTLLVIP